MNILGMGPAELLLIFVIALIVFGPGKLPELARTLGKAMRELRRMSLEVTAEFAKELRDVEAISKEVKETTEAIKQAADIRGTLVEAVEPALPSTGPSTGPSTSSGQGSEQGSGHPSAGESKEEKSSTVQETTAQVETEEEASGKNNGETSIRTATVVKEDEAEDHE